jgi:ParB-like chromosome segregation protein Spo0J
MKPKQLAALEECITKYGFIVPVVTNKDLLIADGERRWTIAQKLQLPQIPVIRLPLKDVDRRTLRQVLNKLRGEHELLGDAAEFERIIQAGGEGDLKLLLSLSDGDIDARYCQVIIDRWESYTGQKAIKQEATPK